MSAKQPRIIHHAERDFTARLVERVLLGLALTSLIVLALITLFIFREGAPLLLKVGPLNFIFGTQWSPTSSPPSFGILPMIVGSIVVMFGAMLFGVPLGLASAVALSEFASPKMRGVLKPAIELLAGVPSVVFGFIGVVVLAPFIRESFGGAGTSVLAGSIILGVMILPTIISISTDVLLAVPQSYRDGALALGATTWQTTYKITFKAARNGLLAAIILGMGRALGETMAVIMVSGNAPQIPLSPLDPARTLTSNIALELGYASGEHRQALFATGIVLFIFIMILNSVAVRIARRGSTK